MANKSTTFTKFDRNRFRKIYPVTRFPASFSFRSNKEVVLESLTISFSHEDSKTVDLSQKYSEIPALSIGVKSTSNEDLINVNIFISSISINQATQVVTITVSSSAKFTGDVDVQSMSLV